MSNDNSLTESEIQNVLANESVIRIAFAANDEMFLVPLGYVWLDSKIHGVTTPGRKLNLARQSPKVAFQIDTSSHTGIWNWQSVSGEGRIELITLPKAALILPKIMMRVKDVPAWFAKEQAVEFAAGHTTVWRIHIDRISGRRLSPPTNS